MKRLPIWLPKTLFSRVLVLYASSLFLFTFATLGLFYYHQFTERIDDAVDAATVLANVITPTLSDSVVIGDYDTVQRALSRCVSGTTLARAEFIDVGGTRIRVEASAVGERHAPAWLETLVDGRILDINQSIAVGGKDYGVLRLSLSAQSIAEEIWKVTQSALLAALLFLLPGLVLIWMPLRRIAADLASTARFASKLAQHHGGRLETASTTVETQKLADSLNRVSTELAEQHAALAARQFAIDQHAMVCITSPDGTILYANERLQAVSGYTARELVGSTPRLYQSGQHEADFYRDMWHTIASGQVWRCEYINRRKDGELYWVATSIVPILGEDGRPQQYISIQTDISEQKRTEHALAEARRREIETGSEIQRSLLLSDLPWGIHGAHLATYTEPSQGIDGDFFAITRFRPDCFEVLVGDVMGKGVPAALIGAGVKSSYNKVLAELFSERASDHRPPTPAEIVNALHTSLTPRLISLNSFVTLALYRIDNAAGTLQFVSAGHTPGMLARKGAGHAVEMLKGDNLPVGVIVEEHYVQREVAIAPDDTLLVFSDGITEAINTRKELFGIARLRDILHDGCAAGVPPTALLQSIRHQVRAFAGEDALADDQTALVIEVSPQRGKVRGSLRDRVRPSLSILPWRLDHLGSLRAEIARLAFNLSAEQVDALVLASFEAATNILRHARPYFSDATLACRFHRGADSFAVELIYPGPVFDPPDEPQPDFSGHSEGGFGLYIIQQSVDEVTYRALMPGISSIRLVMRRAGANSDSLPAA